MAATPTPSERPLRADARRNRDRVVEAAREAFAEEGVEAQMETIARRAGVGVGTVYRHFPTKDTLVRTIVTGKFDDLAREAREVLAAGGDPWAGMRHLLAYGGERHALDRTMAQVWAKLPHHLFAEAARDSGLEGSMAELLRRAQAAGSVRPDLTIDDVPLVMCAMSGVVSAHEQGMPGTWQRFLALVFDGMTARGADPLPA